MVIPYLLTNLDFPGLFRFVSPSFFKTISPAELFKIAPKMQKNYYDQERWETLLTKTQNHIRAADFGPETAPGHHALRLFFFQILREETWILDFRAEAFPVEEGKPSWEPKPLYYQMSPEFLANVRQLYRGFYTADDPLFTAALDKLGLTPAKDCLLRHFGEGDQTQVRFQLQAFQSTFTDVFEACNRHGLKLQTEFFVLGLMLLTLYQNLETIDRPQNARGAFLEAWEKAQAR